MQRPQKDSSERQNNWPDKKLSLPGASRKQLHQRHLTTAKNWMSHLPGNFADALMISSLAENKKRVRELITSNHPNLYRASARETLVLQAYVKITNEQLRRLGRVQEYITGGLRLIAPVYEQIKLRDKYLFDNFTTLRHEKKMFSKKEFQLAKEKKDSLFFGTNVSWLLRLIRWRIFV